jgi:hypothetical protein
MEKILRDQEIGKSATLTTNENAVNMILNVILRAILRVDTPTEAAL